MSIRGACSILYFLGSVKTLAFLSRNPKYACSYGAERAEERESKPV